MIEVSSGCLTGIGYSGLEFFRKEQVGIVGERMGNKWMDGWIDR